METLKVLFIMIGSLITGLFSDKSEKLTRPSGVVSKGSLYDYKIKELGGKEVINFAEYKGKKVVLLNTASKCGFTKQYADWETFHEKYGDKVVVIGIPSNNFGGQEPGSKEEIKEFCQLNYGVSFLMSEKLEVTGKKQHALYTWLSDKSKNGWNEKAPTWNFCKYVIDENGKLTNFFASKILPTDPDFLAAVGIKE